MVIFFMWLIKNCILVQLCKTEQLHVVYMMCVDGGINDMDGGINDMDGGRNDMDSGRNDMGGGRNDMDGGRNDNL